MKEYEKFISQKSQLSGMYGFEPSFHPLDAFDFQNALIDFACRKGRAAVFADCGLGKTLIQLAFAQNVVEKTAGRVLVLAPLAVAAQTVAEAEKFGISAMRSHKGEIDSSKIVVTNYDRLHLFNHYDFAGIVCDESSILKHFGGATQKQVTRFMNKLKYRLLCTATAAPNDWIELGTSSEALGELSNSEMLGMFFKQLDDKGQRKELSKQNQKEKEANHFGKLSYRVAQTMQQWRLKGHAHESFWRWVCSWARALRMPSDIGFDDDGYMLPLLKETVHTVSCDRPLDGYLFPVAAFGLAEERAERKRTLSERVSLAASLVNHGRPAVIWCQYNAEGDALEQAIPEAKQVSGSTPDEQKEEIYNAFAGGKLRVLVIKPKIGAWGLNWQHCNHVVTFASHSYEQYYQSVRRCWRFGQTKPVTVDIIATEGEERVINNMARKSKQAEEMFRQLVGNMSNSLKIEQKNNHIKTMTKPNWL